MAEEEKNLNPKSSQPEPAKITIASIEAGDKISEPNNDLLFFNVMPKAKGQKDLVQPSLKNQAISEAALEPAAEKKQTAGFIELLKKYKIYAIIALVILVCAPLAYFLVNKFGGSSYQPEDILAKNPITNNPAPAPTAPAATSTPQTAGFTTPQEWRDKYFPNCTDVNTCGDSADPDRDGLTNLQEYQKKTDPNNPDSDQDGLADGDEVNVFGTDPLNARTANDQQYNDSDYFKGGYDIGTGKKMTSAQVGVLSQKMQEFGLHEPTIKSLFNILNSMYNFSESNASSTSASSTPDTTASSSSISGLDESVDAKQSRDSKRSSTIQNIEIALVKYQADNKTYPVTNDFMTMFAEVKLYLKVATNPVDPINQPPYVYAYTSNAQGTDFSLSFYSEVAGQLIKKDSAEAIKDASDEQAAILDDQRKNDLDSLRTALLLYSQSNIAGTQTYVFPSTDKYKTALVPDFISQIPKDPKTGVDYTYQVSDTFDTFTLKAALDSPDPGTTGWVCNQDECRSY